MADCALEYETILFIQMGGTIDKNYNPEKGLDFCMKKPAYESILTKVKPSLGIKYKVKSVCQVDSKELKAIDR